MIMEEKNQSNDEDQAYDTDFDDTFEIGIPIDEALNPPPVAEFSGTDPETEKPLDNLMMANSVDRIVTNGETEIPETEDDTAPYMKSAPESEPETGKTEADELSSAPEAEPASDLSLFVDIKSQLTDLARSFESKLKYDEHKNKIIDDLHSSLQDYRDGLVKKYLHRIITDIIKVVDDMRKFVAHYQNNSQTDAPPDEKSEKLLKYIENIASDLEDLFSWEGVVPFNCDGDMFDPARQRILKKVETDDPEKDKTIAQRLRPGYEWDGKVIRPEMVSAYTYQSQTNVEDDNNS
ncbi:MAG: nucleotide exchange factor GrpE [Desulfobacterales bacterium]